MAAIKLPSEQVSNLILSGFAPEFRSLAWILKRAVEGGAQMLYDALAAVGLSAADANALHSIKTAVDVSEDELLNMVGESPSFDSFSEVLQRAAQAGAKKMYTGLSSAYQQRANELFENWFLPHVSPLHVEGEPGKLEYDEILEIVTSRTVSQFQYSPYPNVVLEGDYIVVKRPGEPDYIFNEHGASEAVFDGQKLSMPDAQGFPCTFAFE